MSFLINKKTNIVTVTCGDTTATLPFSGTADTLTALQYGLYRSYGNTMIKQILVEEPDIVLSGYSVDLTDQIALNFHMQLSDTVANEEGASVKFTLPDGEGGTATKLIPVASAYDEESGSYKFTCPVAAKQMTDEITAELVVGENTT